MFVSFRASRNTLAKWSRYQFVLCNVVLLIWRCIFYHKWTVCTPLLMALTQQKPYQCDHCVKMRGVWCSYFLVLINIKDGVLDVHFNVNDIEFFFFFLFFGNNQNRKIFIAVNLAGNSDPSLPPQIAVNYSYKKFAINWRRFLNPPSCVNV